MANHVLLDNVSHKDTKINTKLTGKLAPKGHATIIYPAEIAEVQKEYPILFTQDPKTNEFHLIALFGLEPNENLFLNKMGWKAKYIPALIEKGPFLIGQQQSHYESEAQLVVHIDMDHPSVNKRHGEPVFLEQGGNSPYLDRICMILQTINTGVSASKDMFKAFNETDLIEPISLDIEMTDGQKYNLNGYYTINQQKLAQLSAEYVVRLHKTGYLQAAHLICASLSNLQYLVDAKNKKRAKQAES